MSTPPLAPNKSRPAKRPTAKTPQERLRQGLLFAAGFLGWFMLAGVLAWFMLRDSRGWGYLPYFFFAAPTTLVTLIVTALIKWTRPFALGIITALALNFVISLLIGMVENAICFSPFFIQ